MQFPFRLVTDPPWQQVLRRAVHSWQAWVAAGGLAAAAVAVAALVGSQAEPTGATADKATLLVTSVPPEAAVVVDGWTQGRTPVRLSLRPGAHRVTVRHEEYADETYGVTLAGGEVVTLDVALWLRTSQVQRLRPVFPGARVAGAAFLNNGRIALTVAMPPGDERRAWLVTSTGDMQPVGPPEARGSLAVAPDGEQVAYLNASQRAGSSSGRLDEVWITRHTGDRGERLYLVPPTAKQERLIDLSWTPDSRYLLLVSQQQLAVGTQRTRLQRLRPGTGEVSEIITLPSEIVAGSYEWSPDARRVAFLTRSGQLTSLCLLDTANAEFHYLADLSRASSSPLPFPPLSWSPDGERLLYTAPAQDGAMIGGWLFGPKSVMALFIADTVQPVGTRLGHVEAQSPVWRRDSTIAVVAHTNGSGPLALRQVDLNGNAQHLAQVPLSVGSTYAVLWDIPHARALIAVPGSATLGATQTDYWLVQFRPEVER